MVLRRANASDLPMLEVWLNKDYIKQWYGAPEEWIEEIRNRDGKFDWLNHYIVEVDNKSIGFCQYFDCSKAPKGFEWDGEPLGTFAIDYLIGEEIFLGKGFGTVIIQELIELILENEDPIQIIADPVKENLKSIKLLEKNSFILDDITGLFKVVL